ncbi:MAG: hypothetical protein ACLGSD_18450 [Acidobacteriota bacterium]
MSAIFKILKVAPVVAANPVCFRSADGTYMWIERMGMETPEQRKDVGRVFLSTFPNCVRNPVHDTAQPIARWETKEGIRLGSTKRDVLAAYGEPSEDTRIQGDSYQSIIVGGFRNGVFTIRPKPNIGDEVLEYMEKDSLLTAEFGLRKGTIIWMSISENE